MQHNVETWVKRIANISFNAQPKVLLDCLNVNRRAVNMRNIAVLQTVCRSWANSLLLRETQAAGCYAAAQVACYSATTEQTMQSAFVSKHCSAQSRHQAPASSICTSYQHNIFTLDWQRSQVGSAAQNIFTSIQIAHEVSLLMACS